MVKYNRAESLYSLVLCFVHIINILLLLMCSNAHYLFNENSMVSNIVVTGLCRPNSLYVYILRCLLYIEACVSKLALWHLQIKELSIKLFPALC